MIFGRIPFYRTQDHSQKLSSTREPYLERIVSRKSFFLSLVLQLTQDCLTFYRIFGMNQLHFIAQCAVA